MNESFLLKHYGGYDIFEQNNMTGEERRYLIRRINEEIEKKNKANSGTVGDHHRDHTPGSLPI